MRLIEKIQTSVISWAKANMTRLRGITCMQKTLKKNFPSPIIGRLVWRRHNQVFATDFQSFQTGSNARTN